MKNIIKISLLITLFIITGCADTDNNSAISGSNNAGGGYPNNSGKFLWVETMGKELPKDYPVLVEVLTSYTKSNAPVGISIGGEAVNISVDHYKNIINKLRNYYKKEISEQCGEVNTIVGPLCVATVGEVINGKSYLLHLNYTSKNQNLTISYTIIKI